MAVPAVPLGLFGELSAFGRSINSLSMFALVLVVGLLVDGEFSMVENVERAMHQDGIDAVEATERLMGETFPALVGIILFLFAVFRPIAFLSRFTGAVFRQISVTIISAMDMRNDDGEIVPLAVYGER